MINKFLRGNIVNITNLLSSFFSYPIMQIYN